MSWVSVSNTSEIILSPGRGKVVNVGLLQSFYAKITAKVDKPKSAQTVCYFLVCFKSTEYVAFLLASLYNPVDIFIVHCDKKAPKSLKRYLRILTKKYKNIAQMESKDYSWAGFSHVNITLEAMRFASNIDADWAHFVCLSEQHLPLKGPDQIRRFLQSRKSMAVFRNAATMVGGEIADLKNRFAAVYKELPGVGCFAVDSNELGDDVLPNIYHGSNWIILCRPHCLTLLQALKNGQFKVFEQVVHAEETAIQSILAPLKSDIEVRESTLVAFPHLTDNHSLIMTESLFKFALDSDYLFIRKRMDVLTPFVVDTINKNHFVQSIFSMKDIQTRGIRKDNTSRNLFDEFQKSFIKKYGNRLKIDRIDPDVYGSVPRIHWIVSTPEMVEIYSVRILSENYRDYKVCFVKEEPHPIEFALPFVEDGVLYSSVRARLFGLFCYRDILPLYLNERGFVTISKESDITILYEAVENMLNFAEIFVRKNR